MKSSVNDWVDQFPKFHELQEAQQIVRLVYFHTIKEKRQTISRPELELLFEFIDTPVPENLSQKLAYQCGQCGQLIAKNGEYSLRRRTRTYVEQELAKAMGRQLPPKIGPVPAFDFPGRVFTDKKVETP